MSGKRRKYLTFACAGTVLIATVFVTRSCLRHNTLQQDALEILSAYRNGDARALFKHALPWEPETTGLTQDSLDHILHELVLPRLERYHATSSVMSETELGDHQASAWVILRDDLGRRITIDALPYASDDWGRQAVLPMLFFAWRAEYSRAANGPASDRDRIQAYLQGLRTDKERLQEWGIKGFVFVESGEKLYTFDEIEQKWESSLAKLPARASKPVRTSHD